MSFCVCLCLCLKVIITAFILWICECWLLKLCDRTSLYECRVFALQKCGISINSGRRWLAPGPAFVNPFVGALNNTSPWLKWVAVAIFGSLPASSILSFTIRCHRFDAAAAVLTNFIFVISYVISTVMCLSGLAMLLLQHAFDTRWNTRCVPWQASLLA